MDVHKKNAPFARGFFGNPDRNAAAARWHATRALGEPDKLKEKHAVRDCADLVRQYDGG